VIDVNWHDAKGYAAWLSLLTGKSYRLLSEAEWEYCCRAGSKTLYSFGNVITTDDANYSPDREHSATGTIEVGRHAANAFGLYDMHGNVCEWCEDAWHDGYDGAPTGGSAWIGGSSDRVVRGGCWNDYARRLRASDRWPIDAADRSHWVGFRVARDVITGGER
jgi:formylglycine-generating enzyme required for sulfatase activity